MKPQVNQHFRESCQVTESGVTEPGLQAGYPLYIGLTRGIERVTDAAGSSGIK